MQVEFEGAELVGRESLIKGIARIRDVEVGIDGIIYLPLELGRAVKSLDSYQFANYCAISSQATLF